MTPIDDRIREELSALLDGALPEDRAAELSRRLETDESLRREYESLRRAVDAVRALPHAPAPTELRVRIDESLRGRPPRAAVFRFGMLAAAAAVVLATGLFYFLRPGPPPSYEARDEMLEVERQDDLGAKDETALRVAPDSPGKETAGDALEVREKSGRGGTGEAGGGVAGTTPSVEVLLEEAPAGARGTERRAVRALEESEGAAAGAPAPDTPEPQRAADEAQAPAEDSRPAEAKRELPESRGGGKSREADLLRAVEKEKRLPAGDRQAYLRQLAALDPAKARQHVLAVFGAGPGGGEAGRRFLFESLDREGGTPALLAAVSLTDRNEAALVTRILGAVPLKETEPSASVSFFARAEDQIATEIEGTPDELARIRSWLALLDLDHDAAEPDVMVSGATKKAKDAPKRVRAVVRLKYPPRPEAETAPAPTAPAPAGEK